MKARVKYNNEIIDVFQVGTKTHLFDLNNVEFLDNPQDYWAKLEHQYAGMAMQQLVSLVNVGYDYVHEETAIIAYNFAHALVEKLKELEEKK